eukprot:c7022_g1_i1.p1 GENE.c7022_g1_i1~~c7022_g1_i1.p1  ORF type:complete len:774 (+),score=362.66 c7022_g1_i1:21-2342(+)
MENRSSGSRRKEIGLKVSQLPTTLSTRLTRAETTKGSYGAILTRNTTTSADDRRRAGVWSKLNDDEDSDGLTRTRPSRTSSKKELNENGRNKKRSKSREGRSESRGRSGRSQSRGRGDTEDEGTNLKTPKRKGLSTITTNEPIKSSKRKSKRAESSSGIESAESDIEIGNSRSRSKSKRRSKPKKDESILSTIENVIGSVELPEIPLNTKKIKKALRIKKIKKYLPIKAYKALSTVKIANQPLPKILLFTAFLSMILMIAIKVGPESFSAFQNGVGGHGHGKSFRPNFVIFFPDDMGYNDVTYTNPNVQKPYETTNIDYLAKTGIRLTHYYTTPNCAPSRCALITGRYTNRNGCQNKDPDYVPWGVPLTEPFIPTVLKKAGYYNVMLGKWHLGMFTWSYTPTGRGFDEFVGFLGGGVDHFSHTANDAYDWWNGNETDKDAKGTFTEIALNNSMWDFMANRGKAKQPWFMYIPAFSPHGPYEAPDEWVNKVNCNGGGSCAWMAMMLILDDFVGSTVNALKTYGMYENTMVIYAGDHGAEKNSVNYNGYLGRDYPFSGEKGQLWEGGCRVPAFVHAPFLNSALKGTELSTLTGVWDWLPTLASLAGADLSSYPTSDGADLSSLLIDNKNAPTRDHLLITLNNMCEYKDNWDKPYAAIRVGQYKMLVGCVTSGGAIKGNVYLYDIGGGDYTESTNLMKNDAFTSANADLITYIKGLLSYYGTQSVAGLTDGAPWQGNDYWCANCKKGCPNNGIWAPYYTDAGVYIGGNNCNNGGHK